MLVEWLRVKNNEQRNDKVGTLQHLSEKADLTANTIGLTIA